MSAEILKSYLVKIPQDAIKEIGGEKFFELFKRATDQKCKAIQKIPLQELKPDTKDKIKNLFKKLAHQQGNPLAEALDIQNNINKLNPKDIHKQLNNLKKLKLPDNQAMQALVANAANANAPAGGPPWLGPALAAANLAATIVCTIIICNKLDDLNTKMDQIMESIDSVKKIQLESEIQKPCRALIREYKVLSSDIERGKPVSEKQLLEAIDHCYSCIESALKLRNEYSLNIILSIVYSLLPCFTNLIILYYQHYFNPEEGEYVLHKDWMSIYDTLCSNSFRDEVQMDLFLNQHLHNETVNETLDLQELAAQGLKAKINITLEDLKTCGNVETYQQVFRFATQYAMQQADNLLPELKTELEEAEAKQIIDAIKQQIQYT